jgi:ribose-phosphate pyrophosphokinase
MSGHDRPPLVLAGSRSVDLARSVTQALGVPLGDVVIERFPDGELAVEVREVVRARDVYAVQSTGAPVGEALLELALIADACRRGGASRIEAIVPYVGFARQDRRRREGEAVGIRVVADMLASGRFERVVAVDLHAPSSEGCFRTPLDHVSAVPLLAEALRRFLREDVVVVAPDAGAVRMAHEYGRILGAPVAHVHKTRRAANEVEVERVEHEVGGKRPLIVDDMISTGATIAAALDAVLERGAQPGALVVATHLLPGAGAAARLAELPIERIVVTDSLAAGEPWSLPLARVSLAPLLTEVLARSLQGASLGELISTR